MSPIIARVTVRNVAATGRRQFSVIRSMRSFGRSFEPHVFQRLPNSVEAQSPDYGRLFRRGAMTVALYALHAPGTIYSGQSNHLLTPPPHSYMPFSFAVLGWPVLAEKVLDGHVI